ncbi:AAA family ATPase [Thermococcus gorgonarius]|uniref:ATPase n=1 Tax=Thermococcus gorgonarius TaxID=71997 RepID=A0A2Z2MDQ5_THEGO|nr:ATP-binding protein [Thermococcus gorgonarius]ASJ00208.1 ATPase [Thermococcus gorgonarius]
MYFDERPKSRREDLYDREGELEGMLASIKHQKPLVVLKGLRRLGKTSLLRVALNEAKKPHVIVDLRGVNPNSRRDLYLRFQAALNEHLSKNAPLFARLKGKIKLIDGVSLSGIGVSLSWKNPETLYSLISALESEGFVIAFDEVQEARGPAGKELASLIAHFYDYGETTFILTGSEVGLLYDFLGVENPDAPLYGRAFHEIELSRFSREQSLDFLRRGFEQAGVDAPKELLEEAVDRLDGIVGWLVKFGVVSLREGLREEVIDKVLEEASKLALAELERFLEKRPLARRRYLTVLRAIASGKNTWSELKRELEGKEKREIEDATLARLLNALLKASFIEKRVEGRNIAYSIADPVLEFALSH